MSAHPPLAPLRLLVIGSGELGMAVLQHVTQPTYHSSLHVTLMTRNATHPTATLQRCQQLGVELVRGDVNDGVSAMADCFRAARAHTVLSCVGYNIPADGQRQIAQACVEAGCVERVIVWEFGFAYEEVGFNSPQPIFDEKLRTRAMVEQCGLDYFFLSCGVFTEFLFSDSFGVVNRHMRTVTAPGSLQHRMTTTCLDDIGAMTARLLVDSEVRRQRVRIQGDTVTYKEVADIMEQVTGQKYERVVVSIESLQQRAAADEKDIDARYHLAMAKQSGIHYPMSTTYNAQHGIRLQLAKEWAEKRLLARDATQEDDSK